MKSGAERRPLILIVEDESLVRELMVSELQDAGYEVLEAADGGEALAALNRSDEIDLLFTDIRLPGAVDGWTIAEAARRGRPEIKVLYATGFTPEVPRQVDGSVLLRKPYRPDAVLDHFRKLGVPPTDGEP